MVREVGVTVDTGCIILRVLRLSTDHGVQIMRDSDIGVAVDKLERSILGGNVDAGLWNLSNDDDDWTESFQNIFRDYGQRNVEEQVLDVPSECGGHDGHEVHDLRYEDDGDDASEEICDGEQGRYGSQDLEFRLCSRYTTGSK